MAQAQKRELLPEQAAAAYEIEKHISVTAGPGSGKTTVLVERYLQTIAAWKRLATGKWQHAGLRLRSGSISGSDLVG